jgi:hypothetical protein
MIVVCTSALALAGSPQLHQFLHHNAARTAHSCAITLPKAGKCTRATESPSRPLVRRTPTIALQAPRPLPGPVWISKPFLEACRFEHGPPVLC